MLRREGRKDNVKRVYRLYREEGLNWPPKSGRHEVCYFDLVEDI